MSHEMSGQAVCDVPSCPYRTTVTVQGGDVEYREEQSRVLDSHRRAAHPWLSVTFAEVEGLPLWACGWCGSAVADTEAHARWHQTSRV